MKAPMLNLTLRWIVLFAAVNMSVAAQASTETYKGQSEINEDDAKRSCQLTLERDEKTNEIIAMKLEAPARMFKLLGPDADEVEITSSKAALDLSGVKRFSEFRFQKQIDLQGEGFMLRGEKILKAKKDERLFIHFDVREGALTGVQFAQREKDLPSKTKPMAEKTSTEIFNGDKISIEKACSGLKKL